MYTTRYLNVIKHLVVNQLRHKEGLLVIPDEEAKLTSVGHLGLLSQSESRNVSGLCMV